MRKTIINLSILVVLGVFALSAVGCQCQKTGEAVKDAADATGEAAAVAVDEAGENITRAGGGQGGIPMEAHDHLALGGGDYCGRSLVEEDDVQFFGDGP